jgi:hypothetical protein
MKNLFALLIFTFIATTAFAQTKMKKGDSFDAVLEYCPSAMGKIPFKSKDGAFSGTGKTNSPNWRYLERASYPVSATIEVADKYQKKGEPVTYIYKIVGVQ